MGTSNKIILTILLSIYSAFIAADVLRIEHIDLGYTPSDYPHLYFDDGRVGILKSSQLHSSNFIKGQIVDVQMSRSHTIKSIRQVNESDIPDEFSSYDIIPPEQKSNYEPTILPNLATATAIFNRMNRKWTSNSECYNRAHIWNFEEFERSGLFSKKVFIFFSRRYIRNYKFHWWFHAIPTVLVKDKGQIVERALDPRYVKQPLPMKSWSDVFVKSKRACRVITKYSSYYNNEEKEDCFLHFSSMYMWKPRDLEKLELTGFEKEKFLDYDVRKAYKQGYNVILDERH